MNVWVERLRSFMNEHQEWHAFVIGWADGASCRKTDWSKMNLYYGDKEQIGREFHYYKFGLPIGLFTLFVVIAIILKVLI